MIVLSHIQARELLEARKSGLEHLESSVDLNRSRQTVRLDAQGVCFHGQEIVPWSLLESIAGNENSCFRLENGRAEPVRAFSERFGLAYSLYPTESAPTMLVSGIPMHRIKGIDPWGDSQAKISALGRVGGRILDTASGLGYTAVLAARAAEHVISIELDPAARRIARANPWSQELFEKENISLLLGDTNDLIAGFVPGAFQAILHDPPVIGLAGGLYSLAFYRQAFRALERRGRMFHYIGNPESRSGAGTTRGVVQRLRQAGFRGVDPRPEAFGVTAIK